MSANESHTEMAKDVARKWIEKHAQVEYRMTVFLPSYDDAKIVKKYMRIATGSSNTRIPKISNAKIFPGIDSVTVISPDEAAMLTTKRAMERAGYEVEWGW